MSEQNLPKRRRTAHETLLMARSYLLRAAVLVSLLAPLAIAFGIFGIRQGMFGYAFGQETLALQWAPGLAVVGGVLSLLALPLTLAFAPRRGTSAALFALAVAAVTYAGVTRWKASVAAAPPIHDVATDWSDPLLFGATLTSARGLDANPVPARPVVGELSNDPALLGKPISEINARTCPAALPVVLTGTTEAAFAKAKAALQAEGLSIVTENAAAGRIEATHTTRVYAYKDDVLARVKPEGAGARIDLRASRRTGVKDHGDNCALIARLRARLAK
jgi:fatty-acyl-CoA synthase